MTRNIVEKPMQVAEHEPYLQVTWRDALTPARGYVVIDQLVTGIATGGLRMRPGCTADEVAALAREMTLKMGAFGIHVGGAKGGIDFDSTDPRADDVRERFLTAVQPLLDRFWVTAGDLGTQQEQLDRAFARVGIDETSFHAAVVRADDPDEVRARVRQAFDTRTEGLKLAELVGGYGVAEAALAALQHRGVAAEGASAVVQGFGAMGGSTALYLARAGVKIVGITDVQGMIVNRERGLDVPLLLSARTPNGTVDRSVLRADDSERPGEEWLEQPVDVLVPAAVSYCITGENCDRISAGLIVEAANVPTTPEAEARLLQRGTAVVPDFIANTGAAAGAWWVILGEVVSPAGACARLSAELRPLVRGLMSRAEAEGCSIREAGGEFARENVERLTGEYGSAVAYRELYPAAPQSALLTSGDIPDEAPAELPDQPPRADAPGALTGSLGHGPGHPAEPPLGTEHRPAAAAFPAYAPDPHRRPPSGGRG